MDFVDFGIKAVEGAAAGIVVREGIKQWKERSDNPEKNWEVAAEFYEEACRSYEKCMSRIRAIKAIHETEPRGWVEEELKIREGYVELYFSLVEALGVKTLPDDAALPVSHNVVTDLKENVKLLEHQRKDLIRLYHRLIDEEWEDRPEVEDRSEG